MKKQILKANLDRLSKILKRDDLSIDQSVDNGRSHPVDYIFYKIHCVINSTDYLYSTNIYCTKDNLSNNLSSKAFKSLRLDKYITKSIDKLQAMPDSETNNFVDSLSYKIKRYRLLFNKCYFKYATTTLLLLFLFPFFCFSQTNIFEKDDKLLSTTENNLIVSFVSAEMGYSLQLQDASDGTYITRACEKGKSYTLPMTMIGVKVNKNLSFTILYANILDKDGVATEYAYVGYMKREYGETKDYLIKIKKTRIYLENNIYTESITINNGIILTVENKLWVKKIKLPEQAEFKIANYSYKNCDSK